MPLYVLLERQLDGTWCVIDTDFDEELLHGFAWLYHASREGDQYAIECRYPRD